MTMKAQTKRDRQLMYELPFEHMQLMKEKEEIERRHREIVSRLLEIQEKLKGQ